MSHTRARRRGRSLTPARHAVRQAGPTKRTGRALCSIMAAVLLLEVRAQHDRLEELSPTPEDPLLASLSPLLQHGLLPHHVGIPQSLLRRRARRGFANTRGMGAQDQRRGGGRQGTGGRGQGARDGNVMEAGAGAQESKAFLLMNSRVLAARHVILRTRDGARLFGRGTHLGRSPSCGSDTAIPSTRATIRSARCTTGSRSGEDREGHRRRRPAPSSPQLGRFVSTAVCFVQVRLVGGHAGRPVRHEQMTHDVIGVPRRPRIVLPSAIPPGPLRWAAVRGMGSAGKPRGPLVNAPGSRRGAWTTMAEPSLLISTAWGASTAPHARTCCSSAGRTQGKA